MLTTKSIIPFFIIQFTSSIQVTKWIRMIFQYPQSCGIIIANYGEYQGRVLTPKDLKYTQWSLDELKQDIRENNLKKRSKYSLILKSFFWEWARYPDNIHWKRWKELSTQRGTKASTLKCLKKWFESCSATVCMLHVQSMQVMHGEKMSPPCYLIKFEEKAGIFRNSNQPTHSEPTNK